MGPPSPPPQYPLLWASVALSHTPKAVMEAKQYGRMTLMHSSSPYYPNTRRAARERRAARRALKASPEVMQAIFYFWSTLQLAKDRTNRVRKDLYVACIAAPRVGGAAPHLVILLPHPLLNHRMAD